jgi:hypothetical protein
MGFMDVGKSNMKRSIVLCHNSLKGAFNNYFKFVLNKNPYFYENCFQDDFQKGDYFFVFDPTEINAEFYSVFPLWMDYIKKKRLPIRLIILNSEKIENLNYNPFFINLIDQNRPLSDKIRTVLAIDDLKLHDCNWRSQAANIADALKAFFKGHGQESLIKILTDLDQYFQQGPQLVAMDDYTVEECVQELIVKRAIPKWESFKERYDKYLLYFKYLPFYKEIYDLKDCSKKVDDYIHNIPKKKEAFVKTDISEEIRKARAILEDIDRKYIGSERPVQL